MAMGATLLILGMSQFSVLDTLTMAPPSSAAVEKVGAAGEVGGTEEVGVTGEEGKVVRGKYAEPLMDTEFSSEHPCSAYSHATLRANFSLARGADGPYANSSARGDGMPYFLTVYTLLGGWATADQVTEWILWHAFIGVDHFAFHVFNASPELRTAISKLQEEQGISIAPHFSDNAINTNDGTFARGGASLAEMQVSQPGTGGPLRACCQLYFS